MKRYVSAATLRAGLITVALVGFFIAPAGAQTLPAPWSSRDIGAPALAGSATYSSGVFTVSAGGNDVWNASDQFRFVYQQVSGNVTITARVDDVTWQNDWSKSGIMIRASLDANAANGFALVSANNGLSFQRRTTTGGVTTSTTGAARLPPMWVRLVRSGSTLTASQSADGTTWTTIGSASVTLPTAAYVGIAVSSHNVSARTTSHVSNVTVQTAGSSLPAGQTAADIGNPAVAGSTSYSSGAYTIRAAGADIWDTADQFRYVYQPMTGNGEVIARVQSITNANAWSKAGVMIRESLNASSRHAMVVTSAGKGYAFQRRLEPAEYTAHTSGGSGAPPGGCVWFAPATCSRPTDRRTAPAGR